MGRSVRSSGVLLVCVSTSSWVILIFVFFLPLYRPRAGIVQRTTSLYIYIHTSQRVRIHMFIRMLQVSRVPVRTIYTIYCALVCNAWCLAPAWYMLLIPVTPRSYPWQLKGIPPRSLTNSTRLWTRAGEDRGANSGPSRTLSVWCFNCA